MRKSTVILSSMVLATSLSFAVQAAGEPMTNTTATPNAAMSMPTSDNPCQKIEAACKDAGYMLGGAKTGKGLMKNCMGPIMAGKTVEGVKVEATDVAACKEKGQALRK